MTDPSHMGERLALIAALTELNSRHLAAVGRRSGEAIELARALADLAADGRAEDPGVGRLRDRLAASDHDLEALEQERARLDGALAQAGAYGPAPTTRKDEP